MGETGGEKLYCQESSYKTNLLSIVFFVVIVERGHLLGTSHGGVYIATLH